MSDITKKLRLKEGQTVLVVKAPEGFLEQLGDLPESVDLSVESEGVYDFILVFVKSIAELETLAPEILNAAHADSLLWLGYPKKSSKIKTDISRDMGWEKLNDAGWRQVSLVSVDETWSAMRFRPYEKVNTKK
ncbi:MAG TPA: hypothetical protein VFK37_05355 [Bacillales bacterium]|nr:hypothetical protein [Bacillales bacterium]